MSNHDNQPPSTAPGSQPRAVDEHLGERLSGYLDGELTQQQRQQVEQHCAECAQCKEDLAALREMRERIAGAALSPIGTDQWREDMQDSSVQTSRSIGWLMFIVGAVLVGMVLIVGFLAADDISLFMKFIIVAVYGGLATLLYSVLRQRLVERKTDKYKDVEI